MERLWTFRSYLFWMAILSTALFDLITGIGNRAILLLLQSGVELDVVLPWLVIATGLESSLAPLTSMLNLIYVISICYVVLRKSATSFDFLPNIQNLVTFGTGAAVCGVFYLLFTVTFDGYPAIFPNLGYQDEVSLYLVLLSFSVGFLLVVPMIQGIITGCNPQLEQLRVQVGPAFAALCLITGGLAAFGRVEYALAILSIVVSIRQLTNFGSYLTTPLEKKLIRLLGLLEARTTGFAIVFGVWCGIYIGSLIFTLGTADWKVILTYIWYVGPGLGTAVFVLGLSLGVGVIGFLTVIWYPKVGRSCDSLLRQGLVLLASLWFFLGGLFAWQLMGGPGQFVLDPTEPVVYLVFLSTGVLLIGLIEELINSVWVYYGCVMILFLLFGRYFLTQSIHSSITFLNFAVMGYWITPILDQIGFRIAQTRPSAISDGLDFG